jgi:flagellar hook-length control protein FliK
MSLQPSTPPSTAHATTAAAQARARQAGLSSPAHGAHGGSASPFAQLLQGMGEDEPVAPVASSAPSPDTEPTAEEAAEPEEKKTEEHARKRDDDNTAQPAAEAPVPAADRVASLGQAGWLAAARAKAALAEAAAKGRHAAALNGPEETRADTGSDASRLSALGALPGTGTDAAAGAFDGAGWKPALDAATVQLAPAAAAVAEAGAEFSLPSLGEAGSPAPAAPAEAPPPAQATLAPPPGSAAFPAALGAQLSTWLKDGVQYATLELNPQDMGPIDVRIALRDGQAQVELGADVAVTRQILAEALPALAEALGDVGLSLSGGSVSDQTGQQGRPGDAEAQRAFGLPSWLAPAGNGEADTPAVIAARQPRGLVDLVA